MPVTSKAKLYAGRENIGPPPVHPPAAYIKLRPLVLTRRPHRGQARHPACFFRSASVSRGENQEGDERSGEVATTDKQPG